MDEKSQTLTLPAGQHSVALGKARTSRSEAFGDRVTDIVHDGILLRCFAGRDGERVEAIVADNRFSARNVFGYLHQLPPADTLKRREPSLVDVLAEWTGFRRALSSRRLHAFVDQVREAAIADYNAV
jgi:hypothetical protein